MNKFSILFFSMIFAVNANKLTTNILQQQTILQSQDEVLTSTEQQWMCNKACAPSKFSTRVTSYVKSINHDVFDNYMEKLVLTLIASKGRISSSDILEHNYIKELIDVRSFQYGQESFAFSAPLNRYSYLYNLLGLNSVRLLQQTDGVSMEYVLSGKPIILEIKQDTSKQGFVCQVRNQALSNQFQQDDERSEYSSCDSSSDSSSVSPVVQVKVHSFPHPLKFDAGSL